jgi:hypothetical protein
MPYADPLMAKEHQRLRQRKHRLDPEVREIERLKRILRYAIFPEKEDEKRKEYILKNKDKCRARGKINNALAAGKIKKEPCASCGATENIHGHHKDYNKPFDVDWLCAKCHMRRDKCRPLTIDFPMGRQYPELQVY